ncbi:YceI family protein [Aquimarina agarivorans]|uniref:YceI family protein n=1 Tax=Aquimarina agarivorans TaxID=980584 RepID=UPI000248E7AD|nr:YceI family protein [Aquimarina agarivorans]
MKNVIKKLAIAAVAVFALSFTSIDGEKKEINTSESKVEWKGYKVTGFHEGTIAIKSGALEFNGDKLVGGSFVIDMTSLVSTDLEGEYKGKLEGHLKSDDFFGVEKFSTSTLTFKSVSPKGKNTYSVTADLTIKDVTKPVTFDFSVYGTKATASLKIDRTEYNVKYGSASFFDGLKDKAIYDEFDILVDLKF